MARPVRSADVVELRAFCAAVDLGSLGRAARLLRVSQPALSKRLRTLEALAGAPLLERSPRGVTPTAAGTRLYLEALVRATELAGRGGSPLDRADALLELAAVRRRIGERDEAAALTREARALLEACPDPGRLRAALDAAVRVAGDPSALSQRELTVLRLLVGPLSLREIGDELFLSHNTMKTHARNIYRKLGVASRAEAADAARERGLV